MHSLLLTSFMLAPLSPQVRTVAQDPPPVEAPLDHAALADGTPPTWEFALSMLFVDPPGEDGFTTTILYADRGPLHLEARYQYEDLDTTSVFAGWTFDVGEEVRAALTPMLGGIFGETNGVAPALLVEADWRKLTFYTEAQYVFDTDDSDGNYFYSWSTLMWQFTDVISAGIVSERTKIVDTDRNLQVGAALEVTSGPIGLSLYFYNPGSDVDYYTLSVDFSF